MISLKDLERIQSVEKLNDTDNRIKKHAHFLEYCFASLRKYSMTDGDMSKMYSSQLKWAFTSQIWDNLNTKNNDVNGL